MVLRRFCPFDSPEEGGGSSPPAPIRSSTNRVRIHYRTDGYSIDSLFQLHYYFETNVPHCGGHFTSSSDVILLVTDEPVCLYLIEQFSDTVRIELEFLEVSKLPLSDCDLYNLEVYDGRSLNDPLLLRYCGAGQVAKLTSTGRFLLIRFQHNFHKRKVNSNLLQNNTTLMATYIPLCKLQYRRGK